MPLWAHLPKGSTLAFGSQDWTTNWGCSKFSRLKKCWHTIGWFARQWAKALELHAQMKEKDLMDLISYNSCLSACERTSQWQDALQIFDQCLGHGNQLLVWTRHMFRWAFTSRLPPFQPDIITFSSTISASAASKDGHSELPKCERYGCEVPVPKGKNGKELWVSLRTFVPQNLSATWTLGRKISRSWKSKDRCGWMWLTSWGLGGLKAWCTFSS